MKSLESQLAHIKHGNPFIIGYHSAFLESGSLHILLDYAEHGDLSQAITKTKNAKRQFRQPQVLDWFVHFNFLFFEFKYLTVLTYFIFFFIN